MKKKRKKRRRKRKILAKHLQTTKIDADDGV
jgi:hypothetical protein